MFQFCCVLNGCVLDDAVSFFSGNILFRRQIDRCRWENTAVRMRMYAFGEVFVLIQNGIKPLCSLSPKEIAPFQRQLSVHLIDDYYMTLPDFDSYCAVKDSVLNAYEDRMSWANKMVINIAKAGYFSSDRTIAILFRSVDGCFRLLTRSSPLTRPQDIPRKSDRSSLQVQKSAK